MDREDIQKAQSMRELSWLARYFQAHSREDLAHEILHQLKFLRHRAQDSLGDDTNSDIVKLDLSKTPKKRRKEV